MSIIKFASLKIPVTISAIQKEVAALNVNGWQPHLNRHDYEGQWNVLSLRSPGGSNNTFAEPMNGEEYVNTPLMLLCPSIELLLNQLPCEKLSARLLNLRAGAVIKEHTDKELFFEKGEARLHFPIFTNSYVEFFIDGIRVVMMEGDCWYINANLPHRVANKGTADRIHLVIDCKVNDWLCHIFQNDFIQKSEISNTEMTIRNKKNILNTVSELRRQTGSAVALGLADKLELQLHDADVSYRIPDIGSQPAIKEKLHDIITRFIRSIGITVHENTIEENTFLPGIKISDGELVVDKNKLLYPGDLLHEAGHIAVTSSTRRPYLDEQSIKKSKHKDAEEMMAIAWSYAACIHLNIYPLIVFHEHGYKGDGGNIAENFGSGHYFGTPMLQWCGMTIEPKRGLNIENCFPKMIKWLRE